MAFDDHAWLTSILDSTTEAIIGTTLDGIIQSWNRGAQQLYGYSAADVIGKSILLLVPPDRAQEEAEEILHKPKRGERVEMESERLHADGHRVPVALTIAPIRGEGGHLIGVSRIARGIGQVKKLEEEMARQLALLESTAEGIYGLDVQGRCSFINQAGATMLGYAREELVGKSIHDVIHHTRPNGEPYPIAECILYRAFIHHEHIHAQDEVFWKKDGTRIDVRCASVPVQLRGQPLGAVVSFSDVSARNRLAHELQLVGRLSAVGTLAAGVAHEVNNPLAFVTSNIEYVAGALTRLRAEAPEGSDHARALLDLRDVLEEARGGAARIKTIVRDLKTFSREEGPERSAVDVHRILDSALSFASNEIRHRARLVKDFAGVAPVSASEHKLGQVFVNLLLNAAQAIPEGAAASHEIRVSTEMTEAGLVAVEVRDSGCGIPEAALPQIFDPFFTTKPVGSGTGLGLSISRRIVTELGGSIEVESVKGRGTVFRVFLPALLKEAVVSTPPTPVEPKQGRRGRVLVVDDEPHIVSAVRRTLGTEHDVTGAASATEALGIVTSGERFDVILCDLMMPDVTGRELYAQVLGVDPGQAKRFVFMTGGAFTADAKTFLERVPNPRIEKPYDTEELRMLIRRLVG